MGYLTASIFVAAALAALMFLVWSAARLCIGVCEHIDELERELDKLETKHGGRDD